jgi:hypothetical protein
VRKGKIPSYSQSHTCNIVFDGTFEDFVQVMEDAGFELSVAPAGLINSVSTIIIEKTPGHDDLDQTEASKYEG